MTDDTKPKGKHPRPLRTGKQYRTPTGRLGSRVYDGRGKSTKSAQPTPSAQFDWDTAFYLNACTLKEMGYDLTKAQKKRIKDGRP